MQIDNFAGLALGLAVTFGAASCESNGSTVSNGAGLGDSDAAVNVGQTVTFLSVWSEPGDAEALATLLEVHKSRHPADHIFVDTVETFDVNPIVQERIASGNTPDVFTPSTSAALYLQTYGNNSLQPLDDFLASPSEAGVRSNIYADILANGTYNGQLYEIPITVMRTNALFYNKYVFKTHQLNPPTTLDELRTVCQTLKKAGVTCITAAFPGLMADALLPAAMGIDSYASFRKGTPDETAIRNAIDVVSEMLDNNYVTAFVNDPTSAVSQENQKKFMNGDIAMLIGGTWSMGALKQLGWTVDVDFGVTDPPGNAGLFLYLEDRLMIPSGAPHLQGALNLMDSALSLDGQTRWSKFKSSIPIRMDVDTSYADSGLQVVIEQMRQAKYRIPMMSFMWNTDLVAFAQSTPHDKEALLQATLKAGGAM